MVALPAETAVTLPLESTVATAGALEVKLNCGEPFNIGVVPSGKTPITNICRVAPM
jgi:hypothetical protein